MKFIPLDALVAEIEKRRNDYINSLMTEQVHTLSDILDFINILEVKEVDLDAELEHYKAEQNIKYEEDINMFEFAKHFFELGLKAQKEKKRYDKRRSNKVSTAAISQWWSLLA